MRRRSKIPDTYNKEKKSILQILWDNGAIKFGSFTLKPRVPHEFDKGIILLNQKIRCPKCSIVGMTIEIAPPHKTPYGDEMLPGFKTSFVCDNRDCGYIMSGDLYEP